MAFKKTETTTPVPTHLKWIVSHPEQEGSIHEINLILINPEWKTLTFFSEAFKYNMKLSSDEEFLATRDELYKSMKRGFVKANLKDKSVIASKTYEVEIYIDATQPDKGGRKYELGKNRVSIQPSPPKEQTSE